MCYKHIGIGYEMQSICTMLLSIFIYTWDQIHWILAFQSSDASIGCRKLLIWFPILPARSEDFKLYQWTKIQATPKNKKQFSENGSQLLIFRLFVQETYGSAQCRTSQQSWVVVEHQQKANVYLDANKFTQLLGMIKFPTSEVESFSQNFVHP